MGCSNKPNDSDDKMLQQAAGGGSCAISPEILDHVKDFVEANRATLDQQVKMVLLPAAFDILERPDSELRILPGKPETFTVAQAAETLRNLHPKDVVLFEEFNHLRETKPDLTKAYPPGVPKLDDTGALAKRLIPTVENLRFMLRYYPLSPRDEAGAKIELHHHLQQTKRFIPMTTELHRGEGFKALQHPGPALPRADRKAYPSQRSKVLQWQAQQYLGPFWTKAFKELNKKPDGPRVKAKSANLR
jgi:hypothetical protein